MGTWQPLDGSDPTGILVTSGCLLQPLKCGCSHSKRLKVTGSKRKINPPSCPSLLWEARQTLSDGWRLQNPLQTMTPVIPPSLPLRASRRKLFFCFSDQGKLRHRDEGSGESEAGHWVNRAQVTMPFPAPLLVPNLVLIK